jgi:hypothetical protein
MTVPHHNQVGSVLDLKQKATRCNNGDEILPYMLRLIFGKKIMNRSYVYFYLFIYLFYFFFLKLNEKCPNT